MTIRLRMKETVLTGVLTSTYRRGVEASDFRYCRYYVDGLLPFSIVPGTQVDDEASGTATTHEAPSQHLNVNVFKYRDGNLKIS